MLVREIMNTNIQSIAPDASLIEVAKQMRDGDFGVMPVLEGDKIIGMITDRDITVRAVADSKDVNSIKAREVMTADVLTCFEDDDTSDVAQIMSDRQVRRLPVLDRKNKLVGIVALADLARTGASEEAGIALKKVSEERHDEPSKTVSH